MSVYVCVFFTQSAQWLSVTPQPASPIDWWRVMDLTQLGGCIYNNRYIELTFRATGRYRLHTHTHTHTADTRSDYISFNCLYPRCTVVITISCDRLKFLIFKRDVWWIRGRRSSDFLLPLRSRNEALPSSSSSSSPLICAAWWMNERETHPRGREIEGDIYRQNVI